MQIAVVGTGYVGLVTAACMAELGHTVIGVDIDATKVSKLSSGVCTIYEPGLEEVLRRGLASGRLRFTTDLRTALPGTEVLFCAVATPMGEDDAADLRAVHAVTAAVAEAATASLVFVNKSTVPVGTGRACESMLADALRARGVSFSIPVVSNPEFLREGMAVDDTMMPERIVIGVNDNPEAARTMEELYRPLTRVGRPLLFMNRESAEIVKYASNAFLATKISFINMLTEFAEKTGANIRDIATGMGLDGRIGPRFLHAGIGYGGSCFPKDVKALMATAKQYDLDLGIVDATDRINARQRERFLARILAALPAQATVGIWGLAFKPKTDDMRDAPSLDIVPALLEAGHNVQAYDPSAMDNARALLPPQTRFVDSPAAAAAGADALVLLTEWDVFRGADFATLREQMKGVHIFDGRNVYEPADVRAAGLSYHGIGMGTDMKTR